ncbi:MULTISPECIES: LysR substrate-binding domain-containing protein [Massilia]|uniref:LysR family transcriptional regulator n=1 Tax=Massilia aurea TaxID=373040 RepID=A0A422QLY9_9BURK|nr:MULTISPECIES: LysR substrate-binding domain-containing protein [Massilia]MDY0962258.1 LysR substrate-binding domain-containing protein [Massilia sp. CFBP9026]RNF30953.1 LysR family transcriptional regulator [Massilia aurea]
MLSRDIEIFRTVMTSGSATRAAKVLGLSQPAVSMALRRLEKRAGLELFQRPGGKLQPTQQAQALLAEVQRHFVGMDVIEQRIRSLKQFDAGRVRIAAFPGLGTGFVPRVLADLAAAGTRSMVSLQVMGSQDVRSQVLRDEVELGIAAQDISTTGVEHALFAHYFGVVALPAGHALARNSVITPKQLARHPFVALQPDDAVSLRLDAICRGHGVQLQTAVETSYTFSLCELVRNRIGVALVNPVTAVDYLDAGLVFRPFSERLEFTALTMWPAGRPLSPFVRQMLAAMRARLQADMDRLRATMPPGAGKVALHQFQPLAAPPA